MKKRRRFCGSTYVKSVASLLHYKENRNPKRHRAIIRQKLISVEGSGHCCHKPSSNRKTNQLRGVDSELMDIHDVSEKRHRPNIAPTRATEVDLILRAHSNLSP